MMKKKGYPVLNIHLDNIHANARVVVGLCEKHGIAVSGVIKGAGGNCRIAEQLQKAGCAHLASSRVEQLAKIKKHLNGCETMLLRLPMNNEITDVVKYADISLNSELATIEKINAVCKRLGKRHKVVLMMDLGDLREGFINPEELIDAALHIENELKDVELAGVGTNLGCYGSVKPTVKNLSTLVEIAEEIEKRIDRRLELISGGATTSLPLLLEGKMPERINNLRVGEAILNNMDLPVLWKIDIPSMNQDTFLLKAQIIEVKVKPSHPVGELYVDAFGHMPKYEDIGLRKRALVAMGLQDFALYDKLVPADCSIKIVGSSSDHLIIDVSECKREYKVGDLVSFKMFYGPMLFLSNSEYVRKKFIQKE